MQSLKPIGAALLAAGLLAAPAGASVITTTDDIPAAARTYTAMSALFYFDGPNIFMISPAVLGGFSGETETPLGPGVADIGFSGNLNGQLSINFSPPAPLTMPGLFTVRAAELSPLPPFLNETALEMLQMDLLGGGFMIRESPTMPSLGHETHEAIGPGLFRIDSFFDVFTELSLNGGQTWIPSAGPTRFELTAVEVPEPVGAALLGLGLLGIALRRR